MNRIQLNIQDHIESELKTIIQKSIVSGSINPDLLRMVILSPDSSFERLWVYILEEWNVYFNIEDAPLIGEINISQWLDVADEALEMPHGLDKSFIDRAKEIDKKYLLTSPAINFKHLETFEEAYVAFLECLREELLSQIETAISNVAISFSQADFKHIVGFFTHKLTYDLEDDLLLHAFNHPEGGKGDFYKVELGLPKSKYIHHHLRILESGIQLFCVEGTLIEENNDESEVHTFDISDIAFVYYEDKKIHFRLNDEFQNWTLAPGIIKVEKGDKSEDEFVHAFQQLLNKFPDKVFNPKNVPNPITEREHFQKWYDRVLEYNLWVYNADLDTIYSYGEAAYRYYLQLIPKNHVQSDPASLFLASKLFYLHRFQESVDLYQSAAKLSDFEKTVCLCSMFILHEKEAYKAIRSSIESKSEQTKLELLDTLWLLREPLDVNALKSIEEIISPLLKTYQHKNTLFLVAVVCIRVYTLLDERAKALLLVQSLPTHDTYEKVLLEQELKHVDYIMQAYIVLQQKNDFKIAFEKRIETHSLDTSNKKKIELEKTSYEHSYYVKQRIRFRYISWAHPLNAETFIAVQKDGQYQLILAKIKSDTSVEIVQQITLPETRKVHSCQYLDGMVYMTDAEHGIIRYKVTEESIELDTTAYKNNKSRAHYETFTIADGYVFASNNEYLEIFELNNPEAQVVSASLFIRNSYHLFVHHNLLVAGAGSGFLILVDISNKTNPQCLSTIKEDATPESMHIAFIDDYMVSRSVYDIKDPAAPQWISYVGDELAPTYYFTEKPEVPIISTGSEFLFTTLRLENRQPAYTNWRGSLNADNLIYERAIFNLATAYFDDTLISYTRYEIIFWEKGPSPVIGTIDIHQDVETMAKNCFDFLVEEHPTFNIGKVVLNQNPAFQHIRIAFHACSSLATFADSTKEHDIPIISSSLLLYSYCEKVLKHPYDSTRIKFVYDGKAIIEQLKLDRRFEQMSARHVLLVADHNISYVHFSEQPYHPFRFKTEASEKETIEDIILSKNDNRIELLISEISENTELLNELLSILNMKIFVPEDDSKMNNRTSIFGGAADEELRESEETEECEIFCSPSYIEDPDYAPKKETNDEESDIPSGYAANTIQTHELKAKALKILCALPDKTLVRNIIFNGMKFGYLNYTLKDISADINFDQQLISTFVNNYYGLWDNFSDDYEIKSFLMSNIKNFANPGLEARIAYKCGHLSHPSVKAHIIRIIDIGMTYSAYVGESTEIDISSLPEEVIKPFEAMLLEKFKAYENPTDAHLKIQAEQQLPYYYALLNKLGHERLPEIVDKKLLQAVKAHEQYGALLDDDDEYEDETRFLVNLYRNAKVKRLLRYYSTKTGPLWPVQEPLELYDESWNQTIKALLAQGTASFGDGFTPMYIAQLVTNITLDDAYAHDRELAYRLIVYTYDHIQENPAMASLVEPLVLAVHNNKEVFPTKLDISTLKNKNKYTLLQAAWNDLKNQNFDVAEQKADAVLVMDPTMGQVYFLKARLLWLREGMQAYLAQQEYFIEKAAHDGAAQAQLSNLTGCALDMEKRYDEALVYFKKAALAQPNESLYVANIAEIYYKLGKSKEALKYAKTALAHGNKGEVLKEIITNKGILPTVT